MIGITNFCLPLTVSSGSTILSSFPIAYLNGHISTSNMLASVFIKIVLLSISMNCGFIGGIIFPLITIAVMLALICYKSYPGIPLGMCLACFVASMQCSLLPLPYTFCSICALLLSLGPNQASTVFVSVLTSYTLISGTGVLQYMQKKVVDRETLVARPSFVAATTTTAADVNITSKNDMNEQV